MKDSWNRTIDYMRISITDRCNLRCRYCMPDGIESIPMAEILTYEEIVTVAECAARLGIRSIKVTGGEPLVRKGCCGLVASLKALPGIERVTITTNGVLLAEHLEELAKAGIDGINVSLDTLDEGRYAAITGSDCAQDVLSAVHRAAERGIAVKINAVSLAGPEADRERLLSVARDYPVDVRFIEMMPIGYGRDFETISNEVIFAEIRRRHPDLTEDHRVHGPGPAVYYRIPGYRGSIGFISAVHGKFCDRCNRVRLTSRGYLKTCLCFDSGADLRRILRSDAPMEQRKEMLKGSILQAVKEKPQAHCFERPELVTERQDMVMIGG